MLAHRTRISADEARGNAAASPYKAAVVGCMSCCGGHVATLQSVELCECQNSRIHSNSLEPKTSDAGVEVAG